jgi:hypothetical protein
MESEANPATNVPPSDVTLLRRKYGFHGQYLAFQRPFTATVRGPDFDLTFLLRFSWLECAARKGTVAFWFSRECCLRSKNDSLRSDFPLLIGSTWIASGLPTIGDLGALDSVSAAASACQPHTSYVLLSMHSVIEKLRGAS